MFLKLWDQKIFRLINNNALIWRWLDYWGVFCAVHLIWLIAVAAAVVFFRLPATVGQLSWLKKETVRFKYFFTLIGGSGFAYLINVLIGFSYGRPRPFAVLSGVHQLISTSFSHKSLPSSHATVAFALATAVFLFNRPAGWLMYIAAFLVAWGRVYVGVHYPFDVLAGAILGVVVVLLVNKAIQWI